jgi:hypothetical protein
MKKINKEFVLSDSSVNLYGFRLLTSGYLLSEFAKNPIGYYMHQREDGVVVRWEELAIKDDSIIAKPVINTYNKRGQQTIEEIESGFLNAASVGSIVVLESTDDSKLKLQGQTGPTITKWYNKECSIVDIPGNSNALVLYDKKGDIIDLKNFTVNNQQISFSQNIINEKSNIENTRTLIADALNKNLINSDCAILLRDKYVKDPNSLKIILNEITIKRLYYLDSLSWDELDKQDLLIELKELSKSAFLNKYSNQFGKTYSH